MATFDRVRFEIDLLAMTDTELLQLESDLDDLRPFQPRDAVRYGMVIAELQRRTGGHQETMPAPDELDGDPEGDQEVQAALAAAVAFYLHREKKGELRLDDESLPDHWLEVHREPGAWVFRVRAGD